MKKIIFLVLIANSLHSQNSVITSTPDSPHTINPHKVVAYLDNDTIPFSGVLIQLGYKQDTILYATYLDGKLEGLSIDYNRGYRSSEVSYKNGLKDGDEIIYEPVHRSEGDKSLVALKIAERIRYSQGKAIE